MKKLLFLLFALGLTSLHADTITSGSVGFLKPSTGVVDSSRNWGDKNNANWDIAAASMTTLFNKGNALAIDTGTLTSSLLKSTNTWTGAQVFTSSITFSSPTISIGGTPFIFQSTALAAGDLILHTDGNRAYWGGDGGAPASSGGTGNSTFTVTLCQSAGQVFMATSPFVAIDGCAGTPVIISTFHAFRLQVYTMFPSSSAVTKFQVVKTTATLGAFPWQNWGPQIHSSTGSLYGVPISSSLPFYPTEGYSVHIDSIPTGGDQSRSWGVRMDGWYDPQ